MKNYNRFQPHLTGLYGWLNLDVDSSLILSTLVEKVECPIKPCDPTGYHTTIIHSTNVPLKLECPVMELMKGTLLGFQTLGKYAVALLDSPDLQHAFDAFVEQDLVWDYPSYLPHISVAVSEEVDLTDWCTALNDELQAQDLLDIELRYAPGLYWSNLKD